MNELDKAEEYGRIYLNYALRQPSLFIHAPADFAACPAWLRLIDSGINALTNLNRPINCTAFAEVADLSLTEKRGKDLAVWAEATMESLKSARNCSERDAMDAARQLAELAVSARVRAAGEAVFRASQLDKTNTERLELMEKHLSGVSVQVEKDNAYTLTDTFELILEDFTLAMNGEGPKAIKTGFGAIDTATGGLQKSEMTVLAGFPGSGKTQFAVQVAINAAINSIATGEPVFYYSLEMTHKQLLMRYISTRLGWDIKDIRAGIPPRFGMQAVEKLQQLLKPARMIVETTTNMSIESIKIRNERLSRKHGKPCLIAVDHIHLMRVADNAKDSYHTVTKISNGLANLSKDTDTPLLALAQLRKEDVNRANSRPRKSDLKDSSAIEQDASNIWFVHREEYNHPERAEWRGIAEVLERKNRYGEANRDFYLGFKGGQFTNDVPMLPRVRTTASNAAAKSEIEESPFNEPYDLSSVFK